MDSIELLQTHFPTLSEKQVDLFKKHKVLFEDWNSKINMISRKDIPFFMEKHLLHSLSISKVVEFMPGSKVLDIGTGGGFPGIPLAIMFPETQFTLVDSIGKKINVVSQIASELNLNNVNAINQRVENNTEEFDFIVSRAVAPLNKLVMWTNKNIKKDSFHSIKNGFLCLKGGDLKEETAVVKKHIRVYKLSDWFKEDFFATKKILHVY